MAYGDEPPYQLSRSSLRKKFGARAIDASAPPSSRNSSTTAAGVGAMGGRTPDRNWTSFFRPVTPDTSMFSAGTMGATGASPLGGTANVAHIIEGVPVQDSAPQTATPTMASTPPLQSAPVDYLKAAHQRSTEWKNAQGGAIAPPMAGQVQSGTSFRNKFGRGSIVSGSDYRLSRMMKRATAGISRLFDDV